MEKDMRNKPQLNPAQLITADLWIDFFAQHFNEPPQNVAFAKSVIRIDDFRALLDAANSGLNYKIPCSGVISRPAASTSCRSFFITSAGIHLRSTLTVRTRLRLRTMSIGA